MEDSNLSLATTKDTNTTQDEELKSADKFSSDASLEDFTVLNSLGRGAYGEVVLVEKNSDGKKYAMKIMDKAFMKKEGKGYQVTAEREFLTKLDHPGIVKLSYSFQDKTKLYFVMEFLSGGGFSDFLRANSTKLTEKEKEIYAQFFTAEMVVILEYLHKNEIAHRDFKPENLMLTEEGHIKAIDFATAKYFNIDMRPSEMFGEKKSDSTILTKEAEDAATKKNFQRSSTFVGTALYVSPELLEDSQCSAPADLWALGCIIFLMNTGQMPFTGSNEFMVFQRIKKVQIQWPTEMNPVAKDLIEKLLVREPEARLGAGPDGSANDYAALKKHPYFDGINFDTIFQKESAVAGLLASLKAAALLEAQAEQLDKVKPVEQRKSTELSTNSFANLDGKKDYKVLLTGQVDKKSPYLFYQLRQLVLTDEPKLKYYDPEKNQLKNEIPLNSSTKAEVESKTKFHIDVPGRKYTFKSIDHPAEKWVKMINEICKS